MSTARATVPASFRERPPVGTIYGSLFAALDDYAPAPVPPKPPVLDPATRAALRVSDPDAWGALVRREQRWAGVRAANGARLALLARAWIWYGERDDTAAARLLAHARDRWTVDPADWQRRLDAHRRGECEVPCHGCEVGT